MKELNEYKIIGKIADGGMSVVYKGMQPSLNRSVAIKVLAKDLIEDKNAIERFNREALIIAQLSHPHIIHIIDRGIKDDIYFFVMDLIEGSDLRKVIKEKNLFTNKNVEIIIQICKALSYAHKNGVIHRDVKPPNILIDSDENVVVSDFGIAQLFRKKNNDEKLTNENAIVGTFAYMSPEQKYDPSNITLKTDIYSLGVIMYELFAGENPLGQFKRPSELNSNIPPPLEEIIIKCLELNPNNRFDSVDQIKTRFLTLLKGSHLKKSEKEKAYQSIQTFKEKFTILDIIKENRFASVYLLEKKDDNSLMIMKKVKKKDGFIEAKILSRLSHKNIIKICGVSGNEKMYIMVMEYLSGGNLKERLIQPFKIEKALKIALRICWGLSFAHKNRIIHGNLRPSNICITDTGGIKITDFGLKEHYSDSEDESNWYNLPFELKSTSYDIYSAGIILYTMLTNTIPLRKRNSRFAFDEKFYSLPEELQVMIRKMLFNDPKKRFTSIDEVADIIQKLIKPKEQKKLEVVEEKKYTSSTLGKILFFLLFAYGVYILLINGNIKQFIEIQSFIVEYLSKIHL